MLSFVADTVPFVACRPCHSAVHNAEDEFTLAQKYYTVELLLQHPKIQKSAEYFGKQAVRNL